MATPLSDEIRALITFANETTEAGDTKLGDCVRTLCEGYNGGKNLPSSPLVVPSGAISSRLAALLAYANETTGAGDTTMGDAIRTLCEGYGGGELIFYEKLIGDGTAYINTGAPYVEGYTYAARLCIPQTTNSWVMGAWTGNKGVTVTRNGNYVRLRLNTADTNAVSIGSDVVGYHDIDFVFTTQSNISYTLDNTTVNTGRMASNGGSNVFLFGYSSGVAVGTYARNPSSFQSYTVKNESLNEVMHLVPCTYNGEAGMWDLVSQTFFGNAASNGQFTVEGEIGMDWAWMVWDSQDMNGISKSLWSSKAYYGAVTISSASDGASGTGSISLLSDSITIENDKTIFLPRKDLPRYVAITAYPTTNKFPVAHICRISTSGGYRSFRTLRKEATALYSIFDLDSLFDTYYQESSTTLPMLAVRTNMNTFVGSDNREQLENYLNKLK